MGGWNDETAMQRAFSAGNLKTECHCNLYLQAQPENPAGVLLATGTENEQIGPGCQKPMK